MRSTNFEHSYAPGAASVTASRPSATVYDHPDQVLRDDALSIADKRAILSSWASDANAVEQQPWLRLAPGHRNPVPLRAILDALKWLDDDEPPPKGGASIRLSGDRAAQHDPSDDDRPSWRRHHGLAQRIDQFRPLPLPGVRRDHAARAGRTTAGRPQRRVRAAHLSL
ncbi:hypothetical protein DNX69_08550 [Rhodopseudomonas palustris]|uniref:Uncharacterized protein n=1 Tax=Rhodopseudomonas palustris TaxID=1076 RepID=A0A323UHK2_RHOPL|nr:hypothetical protein [Rhodopseudomonas palustris]PZA12064.1 hypothetical protein DNX69_08550 [Rhodopseudomonas palustris]